MADTPPRRRKEKKSVEEADMAPDAGDFEVEKIDTVVKSAQEIEDTTAFEEGPGYVAVVIGGTGAVGRFLVQWLLASDDWRRVLVIGRRPGVGKYYDETTYTSKLVEIVGPLDNMCDSTSPIYQAVEKHRPHAAFCCLGTTWKDADKSKANFKRVDYTYVTDFAWLARHLHVPSFNLVSSTGASAKSPLLYPRTKGKSENYVKSLNFPLLIIYRPGLLGRPEPTSVEKCYGHISTALPTEFLAKVMERAALKQLQANPAANGPNRISLFGGPIIFKKSWDNKKIYSFAKKDGISKKIKAPHQAIEV